jgi:hypothetical protein
MPYARNVSKHDSLGVPMAKFTVYLTQTVSTSVEVEADDREEAIEQALQSDAMPPGLCAYCSGYGRPWNMDMAGDWDVSEVTDADGNEVK